MAEDKYLLEIKNLSVEFKLRDKKNQTVKAVDHVSLNVEKGKTLAIVGESGCGKSTLGRAVLHLIPHTGGEVFMNGKDLTLQLKKDQKKIRKSMQIVFQDPYASLNPRMRVKSIIEEPIRFHNVASSKEEIDKEIEKVMSDCGLPTYFKDRYPHEFSGGQRQRICIARALASKPDLVILDEPVSALDVSIQSQIINLLQDLQLQRNLTYIFISHDLSVVNHIADQVAVMYLGSLVELAPKKELYENPSHPYTQALLSAIPIDNPNHKKEHIVLEGEIPSASNPPSGCKFRTRCKMACSICSQTVPELVEISSGHKVACHLYKLAREENKLQ